MVVTKEQMKKIVALAQEHKNDSVQVRKDIFSVVSEFDTVPVCWAELFRKVTAHAYKKTAVFVGSDGKEFIGKNPGYAGIIHEIKLRIETMIENNDELLVRDFFKHTSKESDLYDSFRKIHFEVKSGTGTWVCGHGSLIDLLEERFINTGMWLQWDYVHMPIPGRKNDFPINIHIFCSFKRFIQFLETYPAGVETFFKYKKGRSEKQGSDSYDLQTIHNSQKKIRFLESFETWYEKNPD